MKPGGHSIRERVKAGDLSVPDALSLLTQLERSGHAVSTRIVCWLRRRDK